MQMPDPNGLETVKHPKASFRTSTSFELVLAATALRGPRPAFPACQRFAEDAKDPVVATVDGDLEITQG